MCPRARRRVQIDLVWGWIGGQKNFDQTFRGWGGPAILELGLVNVRALVLEHGAVLHGCALGAFALPRVTTRHCTEQGVCLPEPSRVCTGKRSRYATPW